MNSLLEEIKTPGEQLLALIIRAAFDKSGISFLTPDENILQVGYMSYSESKKFNLISIINIKGRLQGHKRLFISKKVR